MTTTHELKVVPPYFDMLVTRRKTFEVRANDRDFEVGDVLRLREWHPDGKDCVCDDINWPGEHWAEPHEFVERTVSSVFSGDPRFGGIEPGYVVLSFAANLGSGVST